MGQVGCLVLAVASMGALKAVLLEALLVMVKVVAVAVAGMGTVRPVAEVAAA